MPAMLLAVLEKLPAALPCRKQGKGVWSQDCQLTLCPLNHRVGALKWSIMLAAHGAQGLYHITVMHLAKGSSWTEAD